MKADELYLKMEQRGFSRNQKLKLGASTSGHKVLLWYRPTPAGAMSYNDTLLTLEINGDVELFRWASGIRSIDQILSGKATPA